MSKEEINRQLGEAIIVFVIFAVIISVLVTFVIAVLAWVFYTLFFATG